MNAHLNVQKTCTLKLTYDYTDFTAIKEILNFPVFSIVVGSEKTNIKPIILKS